MFSFPDGCWYVLLDGKWGKRLFSEQYYTMKKRACKPSTRYTRGLPRQTTTRSPLTSKSTASLSPYKMYRAGLS
jgi:hypothetical protein